MSRSRGKTCLILSQQKVWTRIIAGGYHMRSLLRTSVFIAMLLWTGSVMAAQISIGIRIGPPPPPRVVHVMPARPGPEFLWIDGYWYPMENHYRWHEGYWVRPPYPGAVWVTSRYESGHYIGGYWKSDRGRVEHIRVDRGRGHDSREEHKEKKHDNGRGRGRW
jgi:hypothetical protein